MLVRPPIVSWESFAPSSERLSNYRRPTASDETNETIEMRTDNRVKIILCMDSNAKYLDRRRLWNLNSAEHCKCYTLRDVNKVINPKVRHTSLEYFMLSIGCNDRDHKSAQKVFNDVKNLVVKIQWVYPGIKIIVGAVTSRMDEKEELVKVNTLINTYIESTENTSSATVIYVIRNSSAMEIQSIWRDCISQYAANIKLGHRVACGRRKYVPPPPPAQQPQYPQQYHQPPNQHQYHQSSNQQQYHQTSNQQQYQEQLQLLLSLLFANQNLSASVTNSCNSGKGAWINNRRSDSRVLDECTS